MSRPLGFIPRAAQRDKNEPSIVAALRAAGCLVFLVSGSGMPDLLVGVRGRWHCLEVKGELGPRGGHRGKKLRKGQEAFHQVAQSVGLPVALVRTPEEALRAVGLLDIEQRFDFSDEGGT